MGGKIYTSRYLYILSSIQCRAVRCDTARDAALGEILFLEHHHGRNGPALHLKAESNQSRWGFNIYASTPLLEAESNQSRWGFNLSKSTPKGAWRYIHTCIYRPSAGRLETHLADNKIGFEVFKTLSHRRRWLRPGGREYRRQPQRPPSHHALHEVASRASSCGRTHKTHTGIARCINGAFTEDANNKKLHRDVMTTKRTMYVPQALLSLCLSALINHPLPLQHSFRGLYFRRYHTPSFYVSTGWK